MKENEKKKMSKKRLLAYYLVLAGCILLIAAITVTVIFTVNRNNSSLQIDGGVDNVGNLDDGEDDGGNDDGGTSGGDEGGGSTGGDEGDGGSASTASAYEFISPVSDASISTGYTFYANKTINIYYEHQAIDYAAEAGTEVCAALDGTVESITSDALYGTVITLNHAGDIQTTYMYVDVAEGLKEGDEVARGQVIATIAEATGLESADGAHLHFEVREGGVLVDPETKLSSEDK